MRDLSEEEPKKRKNYKKNKYNDENEQKMLVYLYCV